MKRTLIVFLTLSVLSAAALVFAYADIGKTRNDAVLVTTDVQGDRAAAQGLRIESDERSGSHLTWHTAHTVGDDSTLGRSFAYSQNPLSLDFSMATVQITAGINGTVYYGSDDVSERYRGEPDWSRVWEKLAADTQPGETNSETIHLRDYYEIYPLGLQLLFTDEQGVYRSIDSRVEDALYQQINAWFRIAVPSYDSYQVSITKDDNGKLERRMMELAGLGMPHIDTITAVAPDAVYFVVKNRTFDGELMDMSTIENYGVYRIGMTGSPNGETFALEDHFTTAHPIDASRAEALYLALSADGRQLYLLTDEAGSLMLTVLDADTGKEMQKLPLLTTEEAEHYCAVFAYEDFVLCAYGEEPELKQFALLSRTPDGALQWEFAHQMLTASDADRVAGTMYYQNDYDTYSDQSVSAAWKDGRLAVVQSKNNGASITVYDRTGLLYLGYDKINLDSEGLIYNKDTPFYTCYTSVITASWE